MITIQVQGMTCSHCENAVREELSRIPGVRDIAIDVVPDGISLIRCDTDVPQDLLHEAIAEAGYDVVN